MIWHRFISSVIARRKRGYCGVSEVKDTKPHGRENPETGWFYPRAMMEEKRAARADVISEKMTGGVYPAASIGERLRLKSRRHAQTRFGGGQGS
jgi:hypothetical protein